MAEQFYTILTKVGKAKIANATALGTKVNFCKFQVGDSNGTYYNPTEEQAELRHKVWEGNINNIRIDGENPNWIIIEVLLPSNVGGFMIREAAILDDEDNVVAIAKYPETYKPQTQDGSSKDILIRTILEISNASSVTLKLDPTVILATKKDIEVLENKIRDLKGVYAEDLLNETVIIEGEMHPIIKEEFEKVESQMADMMYKVAGGTATEIILNTPTLIDGYFKTFIALENNNGNDTTINGKPLYKTNTTTSPNLIAGKAVTVWYSLEGDCFFIKASAEGNAVVGDVLAGKIFSNDNDTGIVGTMPNRGSLTQTLTTQGGQYNLSSGYYSGGYVKAQFSNLIASNIKNGVNIGGVVGNYEPIIRDRYIEQDMFYIASGISETKTYGIGFFPKIVVIQPYHDQASNPKEVMKSMRITNVNFSGVLDLGHSGIYISRISATEIENGIQISVVYSHSNDLGAWTPKLRFVFIGY